MNEEKEKEIFARLVKAGLGTDINKRRWRQLEALDCAARLMVERQEAAMNEFRANELTPLNVERVLAETGTDTITDQTLRNKGGELMRFVHTYAKEDTKLQSKTIKKLKNEVAELREEIKQLHLRDAECEDLRLENERLKNMNRRLATDKTDLEKRLTAKNKKTVKMTKLDFTQGGDAS